MAARIIKIESSDQLERLYERSFDSPIVLLKHSDRCGISFDVLEQTASIDGDVHVVVIQEQQALSAEIALRTGHRHQSPQAFVIENGKPVYHATHYGIDPAEIAICSKIHNNKIDND